MDIGLETDKLTEEHDLWQLWENWGKLRGRSLRNLISPIFRHLYFWKTRDLDFRDSHLESEVAEIGQSKGQATP